MIKVVVGCCGFPTSRKEYYVSFEAVELQDTFYNPPNPEKLRKLREEAPENFRFSMKAWQVITHPPDSPTWRKSRFKLPNEVKSNYGYLKPTKENLEAWELVRKSAKVLRASYVILQAPPSFNYSPENLSNLKTFLDLIREKEFRIGIELRGDWLNHQEELRKILEDYETVTHVTDPFKWFPPITRFTSYYFRLHGIGPREVNYRYKYSAEDLRKLKNLLRSLEGALEAYVMFNNVYMREDALYFKELLQKD
ncbi:MAG: DUF72 domain-containing protein [Desulfurococcaceae archaeon TW002]